MRNVMHNSKVRNYNVNHEASTHIIATDNQLKKV
jgi:hypothetical protein